MLDQATKAEILTLLASMPRTLQADAIQVLRSMASPDIAATYRAAEFTVIEGQAQTA